MNKWDVHLPYDVLGDIRFRPFIKETSLGPCWAKHAVKTAARELMEEARTAFDPVAAEMIFLADQNKPLLYAMYCITNDWFVWFYEEYAMAPNPPPKPDPFAIIPAVRDVGTVLIGICGDSGSGKTYSALRVASGMKKVLNKPIIIIDTENNRSKLYAEEFDFLHMNLTAPFTPDRMSQALYAASKHNPACVVIDSISSTWDGDGGILEMVTAGGDKFSAWEEPKDAWRKFANRAKRASFPIIFCIQAQEKYEQKTVAGKVIVRSRGVIPICEKKLPGMLTATILVEQSGIPCDPLIYGTPWRIMGNMRHLFDFTKPLDETVGEQLLSWAKSTIQTKTEEN